MSGEILVIDDNVDSGNLMMWLLESAGHHVRRTKDGKSALEMIQDYVPDVVISDIMMPSINGYEVCLAMKANPNLSNTLFIAHTGWETTERKRLSKQAGFDYHLVKPVKTNVLLEIIDRSIQDKH